MSREPRLYCVVWTTAVIILHARSRIRTISVTREHLSSPSKLYDRETTRVQSRKWANRLKRSALWWLRVIGWPLQKTEGLKCAAVRWSHVAYPSGGASEMVDRYSRCLGSLLTLLFYFLATYYPSVSDPLPSTDRFLIHNVICRARTPIYLSIKAPVKKQLNGLIRTPCPSSILTTLITIINLIWQMLATLSV